MHSATNLLRSVSQARRLGANAKSVSLTYLSSQASFCRSISRTSALLQPKIGSDCGQLHKSTALRKRQFSPRFFTTSPGHTQSSSTISDEQSQTILLTKPSKHIAHIQLNRPKAKNAFGLDTASELIATLKVLEADSAIRCVLLSGAGPDFTSGVDIKSFMGLYQQLLETDDIAHRAKLLRRTVEEFQAPFKQMFAFEKPMICVQHGLSLGLGMELAACCDIRYCTRDVRMAIREVLIGIAADVGSLQLLPRLAAANQSLLSELIYTGRYMTPDEALQIGFVSHIGETKDAAIEKAFGLAETIAQRSPVAVQGSKRNIQFSRDKPFHVGLDYNAVWNAAMMQGNDIVKAIGAIMSKSDTVEYDDF